MANIKVAVRVRPISEREISLTGSEIVVHTEPKTVALTNLKISSNKAGDSRERTRRYGFDYCFDSSDPTAENYASQAIIYETLGETILDALFERYNSCLVAYGQSASGKTYTMMGSKEDPGLTPRVCEGLFSRLTDEDKGNGNFRVSVSYLEVYNERVRDLLKPSSSPVGLRVREHPRLGPYVQGLTHHAVPTLGSLISRVEEGTRARKTASTLQNPTSSRSHALLTLSLLPSSDSPGQSSTVPAATESAGGSSSVVPRRNDFPRGSKLHLVDLAGSESAAACGGVNRLKEGANINKSLVALGNVISALADRGLGRSSPGRRFIPYRDSALTWLLKDVLGGNATTVMLATISPASGSYNETSHTLRFAQRAQSVVNRPVINEDPVSRIIRELRAEVARLKSLLLEKNVNTDIDSTSPCSCHGDRKEEASNARPETRAIDGTEGEEDGDEEPIEIGQSKPSERRHSSASEVDASGSGQQTPGSPRRFSSVGNAVGSAEAGCPRWNFDTGEYKEAKVSEVFVDDEVDAQPVFVDIPTLVAVLIKPDENIRTDSHQIEEICGDVVLEDAIDTVFRDNVDHTLPQSSQNCFSSAVVPIGGSQVSANPEESLEEQSSSRHQDKPKLPKVNCNGSPNFSQPEVTTGGRPSPNTEVSSDTPALHRVRSKLRKQESIDSDLSSKRSSNLQALKKYGSIESLPRKSAEQLPYPVERSLTCLEKRNGSSDKIKKQLNNIREVDDPKLNKSAASQWRNFGAWAARDPPSLPPPPPQPKCVVTDSDKNTAAKDACARLKNQARKQSIDGSKRATISKDSSSSSSSGSKDELVSQPSQQRDKSSRKGSLDQEQIPVRVHTPIQRARRAEIVAAVTERLYSSKKITEDCNSSATTGSTPAASEGRSPESSDVKLATATRMRLQEISRKMLAKRRRICVDTQTDGQQTVRVRDAASETDEPKIVSKDASILTDRHEDFETLSSASCPTRRVKETWTLTDPSHRSSVTRCRDASVVTDDCHDDYPAICSPRNDSGIPESIEDYSGSHFFSSPGVQSDLCGADPDVGRNVGSVDQSTNTGGPARPPSSGSQTRREDLFEGCPCRESRYCAAAAATTRHCHGPLASPPTHAEHSQKNVISISLPDMINITIESSNGLESKIKLFDGSEQVDDRVSISLTDNEAQTDATDALEMGTSTDEVFGQMSFNDFSSSPAAKPIVSQPDGKSFRIENIFHETGGSARVNPRIEIVADSSHCDVKNSLTVTNSVGTFFFPETRENATGMDRGPGCSFGERFASGIRRRSTTDDFAKNTWPGAWQSRVANSRRKSWQQPDDSLGADSMGGLRRSGIDGSVDRDVGLKNDVPERGRTRKNVSKAGDAEASVSGSKSSPASSSTAGTTRQQVGLEQDANFSDDSLDPMEDKGIWEMINSGVKRNPPDSSKSKESKSCEKAACPPDVVAHTKKEMNDAVAGTEIESPIVCEDFEDSQQIDFPKVKLNSTVPTGYATTISDFKSLILGDPCFPANRDDESSLAASGNSTFAVSRQEAAVCRSYGDIGVVRPDEPKSIIKRSSQRREETSRVTERSCAKRVHFAVPEVLLEQLPSSDSETCENWTSEEETTAGQPETRNILEEYLDEAVVFMRNMNSMNEYMSAACAFDRRAIDERNRRCGKAKSSLHYIEYDGRRIDLDERTTNVNSEDEDLNFNVETYEKCLRSMDRLEECLAKVKRHDEILRDNYGIGVAGGSTGAKLDLARSGVDPTKSNECLLERKSEYFKTGIFSCNNNVVNENVNGRDNNLPSEDTERGYGFGGFSDVRRTDPAVYSQLRGRFIGRTVDATATKQHDNSLRTDAEVKSKKIDGPMSDPESPRNPGGCYLVVPGTKGAIGGAAATAAAAANGKKSRPRFTLSKYDSSNESSSSNEALETFMESIDNAAVRSRDKFKYLGSPRSRFLQLLSERRRIVENTRNTGIS